MQQADLVITNCTVEFNSAQQERYDDRFSDYLLSVLIEIWAERKQHQNILNLPVFDKTAVSQAA